MRRVIHRFVAAAFPIAVLVVGLAPSMAAPAAASPAFCEHQLGDKVVTVPCGDDALAEPGMAGNLGGYEPTTGQPFVEEPDEGCTFWWMCPVKPPMPVTGPTGPGGASIPAGTGAAGELNSIEQSYLADLAAIQIRPTATAKKLAESGGVYCGHLMEMYQRYPGPMAAQGVKDGLASRIIAGNPGLAWNQAVGWVQAAVDNFCPDRVTGMYYQ